MSAEAVETLGKVPMSKRAGARVVAPDGLPAEFWGYTDTEHRAPPVIDSRTGCCVSLGRVIRFERQAWLWRDGALLAPLTVGAARDLRLAGPWFLHPIYRDGVRAATRRDELVLF